LRDERLTERNRCAFEDALAAEARRVFLAGAHAIEGFLHRSAPVARHADHVVDGPVDFQHPLCGITGALMQAVDILRNQGGQFAAALEFDERTVAGIRRSRPRRMIQDGSARRAFGPSGSDM
jgi:hypothetical protein